MKIAFPLKTLRPIAEADSSVDNIESDAREAWIVSSSDVIHAAQVTRSSSVDVREIRGDGPRTSFSVDTNETNSVEASSSSSVDVDATFSTDVRRDVFDDDNK